QLNDLLAENGLEPIEAEGNKFDPNLHEAIAHEPSVSPEGTVIRQARRGSRLKDRLLRAARVVVSSGPAKKCAFLLASHISPIRHDGFIVSWLQKNAIITKCLESAELPPMRRSNAPIASWR